MSNGNLVTYDAVNSQLSTVPADFYQRGLSVLAIVWRDGVDPGHAVHPGDELADIQWEDNSRQAIVAPNNCSGSVASVNRNINYEDLPFEPAQWLLILS